MDNQNSADDQAQVNAASGSAPVDGTRQNHIEDTAARTGNEGAGTAVKSVGESAPLSGLSYLNGDMRLADRITIRIVNAGTGEAKLLLAGDPHEKDVSTAELAALIEDHYWKD